VPARPAENDLTVLPHRPRLNRVRLSLVVAVETQVDVTTTVEPDRDDIQGRLPMGTADPADQFRRPPMGYSADSLAAEPLAVDSLALPEDSFTADSFASVSVTPGSSSVEPFAVSSFAAFE
jgi:hypothetical protein